ncbi:hypothetical protein CEXT_537641 [Caerostris extrusa]|uniref:Uncharacterized protein n=1 Tax=Caerostris extrusa TaxID=172846 RepID=A0AAV4UEB4_CAEEX|nr:hypothetical protein CEXT_537641 [Caerostris extrusa]
MCTARESENVLRAASTLLYGQHVQLSDTAAHTLQQPLSYQRKPTTDEDMVELKQNHHLSHRTYYNNDYPKDGNRNKRPVFYLGFNGVTNYQGCFTENSYFDNKAEALLQKFDRLLHLLSAWAKHYLLMFSGDSITNFKLYVEPEETFHPWAEPGAIFTIHSLSSL